jgi:multiple sugar transport system substrate-binding protein
MSFLDPLSAAIEAKDKAQFETAYRSAIQGCNSCHGSQTSADFPQGFQDPGTYPPGDASAQLYGIPISFETYILFSNKDLVAKYLGGVMPKTFDELIAAAEKITKDGAKDGVVGAVMRGIRSDTIMDTFSGVVYDSWGAKEAPPPYGLWFDGA